jgi:hypothetical protein
LVPDPQPADGHLSTKWRASIGITWPLLTDRGVLPRRFEALIFKHDLASVKSQSEAMVIACDRSIV